MPVSIKQYFSIDFKIFIRAVFGFDALASNIFLEEILVNNVFPKFRFFIYISLKTERRQHTVKETSKGNCLPHK